MVSVGALSAQPPFASAIMQSVTSVLRSRTLQRTADAVPRIYGRDPLKAPAVSAQVKWRVIENGDVLEHAACRETEQTADGPSTHPSSSSQCKSCFTCLAPSPSN